MRRKPGKLLPIETSTLATAADLLAHGRDEFHGFYIAKEMRDGQGARHLTAHGTLYRALNRLEDAGLLISRGEDPAEAQRERRPIRRMYRVTPAGLRALADAERKPNAAYKQQRSGEVNL